MSRRPLVWITVFGLGHLRPAPGTWGSLPPVMIAAVLALAGCLPGSPNAWVFFTTISVVCLLFCWGCVAQGDEAEARYGKDPSAAVADEVAGQCVTLLGLPATFLTSPGRIAAGLAAAFLFFRLCDIIKPPPARGIQKVPAGWGILLDDLVAGVYAAMLLQLLRFVGEQAS